MTRNFAFCFRFIFLFVLIVSCTSEKQKVVSSGIPHVLIRENIADSFESTSIPFLGFGFTKFDYAIFLNDSLAIDTKNESTGRSKVYVSDDTMIIAAQTRTHSPIEYTISLTKNNSFVKFSMYSTDGELYGSLNQAKLSELYETKIEDFKIVLNRIPFPNGNERFCGTLQFTTPEFITQVYNRKFKTIVKVDAFFDNKTALENH